MNYTVDEVDIFALLSGKIITKNHPSGETINVAMSDVGFDNIDLMLQHLKAQNDKMKMRSLGIKGLNAPLLEQDFKAKPVQFLESMGYSHVRQINGRWYGLFRYMYTVGLVCNMDWGGNAGGRICFDTMANAARFLETWDGKTQPTIEDGMKADKRVSIG